MNVARTETHPSGSNAGSADAAAAASVRVPVSQPTRAARLRRPSWRDARLLLGLLLVLTSVAVGARMMAAADQTTPVFAARRTLPPGTPLTSDAVSVARIRLTGTEAAYLDARQPLPAGRVLLRVIGPGEILPVSAVGSAGELTRRPVTVPLESAPPSGLVTGSLADVWASPRRRDAGSSAGFASPRRIATSVEVFHVARAGSTLSAARSASVQVLLDESELPLLLDALANGARTAVVPVPGSAPEGQAQP
jgi:hypothetical protein